jgi:hypothetical protein
MQQGRGGVRLVVETKLRRNARTVFDADISEMQNDSVRETIY